MNLNAQIYGGNAASLGDSENHAPMGVCGVLAAIWLWLQYMSRGLLGRGVIHGDEFSSDEATLYIYGPDAQAMFNAIKPALLAAKLAAGSHALLRYGAPDETSVKIEKLALA